MAQQPVQPATKSGGELKISDLSRGQGLTDRYDDLLTALCSESAFSTLKTPGTDHATRFCQHIRHALNADTAYLCNRNSLTIVATSSCNSAQQSCGDTQQIHTALTAMVSDLWNCTAPLSPPDIKVFPDEPGFTCCVVPLDTERDHLLVIANSDTDSALMGDYIADALTVIYREFAKSSESTPAQRTLEASVLDTLHSKYQISSTNMTAKRYELFECRVNESAVEFQGLTLVNIKDKPEPLHTLLPEALYEVAAQWDRAIESNRTARFKSILDTHCLIESAHGYKTLCDNENLARFSDGRSLKIRIHAETLSDYSFIETLRELTQKAVIHSSKLEFAVIAEPGVDFSGALQSLCDRFSIPLPSATATEKTAAPPVSIADEFDLMQVHGVKKPATVRKIKN